MDLVQRQMLFTNNIGKLIAFSNTVGIGLTFGEVYRTKEQQAIYFKTGRSKTMNSRHILRLAVDLNMFVLNDNGRMLFAPNISQKQFRSDLLIAKQLGDYWATLHVDNVWGSDWDRDGDLLEHSFQDPYHFEMRP
jgi:hypothetical protein